ncbi:hypothetical protein A2U01_0082498, partial [Trifolium medium]|nr:hypothetical protein [Trifolium medium]
IADFFGTPQLPNQQVRPIQNQIPVQNQPIPNNPGVPLIQGQLPVVAQEEPPTQIVVEPHPGVVLVNRDQNADEVVRNVQ